MIIQVRAIRYPSFLDQPTDRIETTTVTPWTDDRWRRWLTRMDGDTFGTLSDRPYDWIIK